MKKNLIIGIAILVVLAIVVAGYTIYNKVVQRTNPTFQGPTYSELHPPQYDKIVLDEQSSKENCTFYLGMSKQEFESKINELNIIDVGGIEITNGPDYWDYGNEVFMNGIFAFGFDKNHTLYFINVQNKFPTKLGLKIDDSFEKMKDLYGENYALYETDNNTVYEYMIGDHYFRVYIGIKRSKVKMWEVSKYKFDRK